MQNFMFVHSEEVIKLISFCLYEIWGKINTVQGKWGKQNWDTRLFHLSYFFSRVSSVIFNGLNYFCLLKYNCGVEVLN